MKQPKLTSDERFDLIMFSLAAGVGALIAIAVIVAIGALR
jgi:hypothetical protein